MDKYGLDFQSLIWTYFPFDYSTLTWADLSQDLFYIYDQDFEIWVKTVNKPIKDEDSFKLVEGANTGTTKHKKHVILEKIMTFRKGFCYKISLDVSTFKILKENTLEYKNLNQTDYPDDGKNSDIHIFIYLHTNKKCIL